MTTDTPARRNNDLAVFFTVTFVTTWAFWLTAIALGGESTSSPTMVPFLLGGFGPVFGAIVVRVRRGRRGEPVPAHTVRTRLHARLLWAIPLLLLASASVVGAALLAQLAGGPAVSLTGGEDLIAKVGGVAPFVVSMLIGGPLAEEPGWRGTAFPRLRASMSRLGTGLVLGAAWAVWHLPLFFIDGTIHAEFGLLSWSGLLFSLTVFPMALLTGYAYERGGVPSAVAVHFGINTTVALLTVDAPVAQAFVLGVGLVVALALVGTQRDHRTTSPTVMALAHQPR